MLAVTAVGADVADARAKAYEGISSISFDGAQWRTDIAADGSPLDDEAEVCPMTVPNVLADRYASAELAALWSPEQKVMLERQLWLAVLRAQKDLGIEVPDGVIADYEAVLDQVDLASHRRAREGHPARREGADRGVQRPRRARARPQGHDLPRPHRERRAAADPASLELVRDRIVATLARLARLAAEHASW